jgi:hypothetical protein
LEPRCSARKNPEGKRTIRLARAAAFALCLGIPCLISCIKGHGLAPLAPDSGSATGIRGKIVFTGNWPDSTKEVRVAVLKSYPAGLTDRDSLMAFVLTNLVAFGDTLPRFKDACNYQIALSPGTYGWVLVAWFPNTPQYIFGVKELGAFYRSTGSQTQPSPVHVLTGVMMDGIDMTADLSKVKRSVPFFKTVR